MTVIAGGVVTLTSGLARCQIAPAAGGAVAGFWWVSGGRRIDWLRPALRPGFGGAPWRAPGQASPKG